MKASRILFYSSLCSLLVLGTVRADEPDLRQTPASDVQQAPQGESSVPYYKDHKRGWFWYEKEPEKPKEKPKEGRDPLHPFLEGLYGGAALGHASRRLPGPSTAFQKKAVRRPTPENVEEYYYVQDVARRKALAYANVSQYVMQTNPQLSVDKDYPTVIPGQNALVRIERGGDEGEDRARQGRLRPHFLLLAHLRVLRGAGADHPVLREGVRLGDQKDRSHPGATLADFFNMTIVPSILLVYRNSADALPISSGVISVMEMEDKIYRGVRLLAGEITPQEFSIYDFQKGGAFDVTAPAMKKKEEDDETQSNGFRDVVHGRHG